MNLTQFTEEQAKQSLHKAIDDALRGFNPQNLIENNGYDVGSVSSAIFNKLIENNSSYFTEWQTLYTETEKCLELDLTVDNQFHKITYQGFQFIVNFEIGYRCTPEDFDCSPLVLKHIITMKEWKVLADKLKEIIDEDTVIATLLTHYDYRLPNGILETISFVEPDFA